MLRGSVTASLIGDVLLMHVKEFGQLLIGISSLLEKISRGLYYERMKLSYLCTAEYNSNCLFLHLFKFIMKSILWGLSLILKYYTPGPDATVFCMLPL